MTTAREHFLFARERALEYVKRGDGGTAISSLVSDLGNHEGTRGILHPDLLGLAMGEVIIAGAEGARRFIEGLPIPAEEPAGQGVKGQHPKKVELDEAQNLLDDEETVVDKVRIIDLAGEFEPIKVDRGQVASELHSMWFWELSEKSRRQVFKWLSELQAALDAEANTSDLETKLKIRIERHG